MTAQSSVKQGFFFKFRPYFLNKLKFLKPQIIMNCIFALLSYPLAFAFLWAGEKANSELISIPSYSPGYVEALQKRDLLMSLSVMGIVIGIICLAGLFAFSFVTTIRSFRYLYDKTAVDMDYSLPVNHNTRFFADIAAVLVSCIGPHLIAVLAGLPLAHGYVYETLSNDLGNAAIMESVVVQCMFTGLFICFMEVAFTVLTLSVSGKKSVAFVYPILLNIAVPLIHGLGIFIVKDCTYGAAASFVPSEIMPIAATSPVGMLLITVYRSVWVTNLIANEGVSTALPLFTPEYGIPALIVSLAFIAGAYFLIKYRRTERVGSPYIFKGMGTVISGIIILAMSMPMFYAAFKTLTISSEMDYSYTPNPAGWFVGIVVSTFIVYLIMELINGRGFRKFPQTIAKWAGTVAVCGGVSAVLVFSNGFGNAYYVPSADSVISVNMSLYDNSAYYENNDDTFTFNFSDCSDSEVIQKVIEIHSLIPKTGTDNTHSGVNIEYNLNSGESVTRSYRVSDEVFNEIVKKTATPEFWYKTQIEARLSEYYDFGKGKLKDGYRLDRVYSDNVGEETDKVSVEGFLEAAKKDSENINEVLMNRDLFPDGWVYMAFYRGDDFYTTQQSIPVDIWMENTLNYLNSFGINPFYENEY